MSTTPRELRIGMVRSLLPTSWQGRDLLAAALILTAAFNAVWLFRELLSATPNTIRAPAFTIIADPNLWLTGTKLRIGTALIIAAVSFSLYRGKSLFVSALALAWIMVEHALWWYRSYLISESQEVRTLSRVSSLTHLEYGSWWDAWVILVTMVLLVYAVNGILRNYWGSAND